MIELAFIVCLRSMPNLCEERRISYLNDIGLMTCMLQAQPELARWSELNPTLRVARWSCQWADESRLKA